MAYMNKVLVVDDDPDIRQTIRMILQSQGFQVAIAADGREALDQLAVEPEPCLILLDLLMPTMNGWQFRAAQLQDSRLATFPVVVMSATPNLEDAAIHADALLQKPLDLHNLVRIVHGFCSGNPTATPFRI
jgi:CheY-like chemotaxis protein